MDSEWLMDTPQFELAWIPMSIVFEVKRLFGCMFADPVVQLMGEKKRVSSRGSSGGFHGLYPGGVDR